MRKLLFSVFLAALAPCVVRGASAAAQKISLPRFVAIVRFPNEAYLLPETGDAIYVQRRSEPPARLAALTMRGAAHRWASVPTGMARVNDHWWIASGARTIDVFDLSGAQTGVVVAPCPVTQLIFAGTTVYVYDDLPDAVPARLYATTDGRTFSKVRFTADESESVRAKLLTLQVVATGSNERLFLSHMIGPPIIEEYTTAGFTRSYVVAYERSAERDSLRSYRPPVDDPAKYSAPVRDICLTGTGELVVLRNREDVRSDAGLVTEQGRRADIYDAGGHHRGTASLPRPARFILRASKRSVTLLTADGIVTETAFDAPSGGRIVN